MKKVLLFTAKAMMIIILYNLSLQLISGASTLANIVGILLLVWVLFIIIDFVIKKLKTLKEHEK